MLGIINHQVHTKDLHIKRILLPEARGGIVGIRPRTKDSRAPEQGSILYPSQAALPKSGS